MDVNVSWKSWSAAEEVERALTEKLHARPQDVASTLAILRDHYVQATAPAPEDSPVKPRDDARILATALAAGADVLVTGDRDLLDVRDQIEGIIVRDPRGFWEMHRRSRPPAV